MLHAQCTVHSVGVTAQNVGTLPTSLLLSCASSVLASSSYQQKTQKGVLLSFFRSSCKLSYSLSTLRYPLISIWAQCTFTPCCCRIVAWIIDISMIPAESWHRHWHYPGVLFDQQCRFWHPRHPYSPPVTPLPRQAAATCNF